VAILIYSCKRTGTVMSKISSRNSFCRGVAGPRAALSLLTLLCTFLVLDTARAQDAQYWTIQYGNRARLLGGAVIGSTDDVSAVFYNPGALATNADRELLLSGNVAQFTSITLQGAIDQEDEQRYSRFAGIPALFAGEFRGRWLGSSRLAYSFLTRASMGFRMQMRGEFSEGEPEFAQFAGDVRVDTMMREYWGGLTWALPLGPRFGAGITAFVASRDQRWDGQNTIQAESTNGDAAIALVGGQYSYNTYRLLGRLGVSFVDGPLTLGATVTTPALHLVGSGDVGLDQSLVIQDLDGSGDSFTQILTNYQKDLDAEFRSPLALGIGGSYEWGATRVHVTGEWFDAIPNYTVISAEPVVDPETGDPVPLVVEYAANSVLNGAVGVEHHLSERTSVYAGFRTDFSTIDPEDRTSVAISSWDLYHISGGATFGLGQSDFTFGGIYAFGSEVVPGFPVTPSEEGEEVLDAPETIDVDFRRFTIVLGYKVRFGQRGASQDLESE
jgi:hypothetical protein